MLPKQLFVTLRIGFVAVLLCMAFVGCEKTSPWNDNFTPPYDINVKLEAPNAKAAYGHSPIGYISFRQDPDPAKIITLDTWIGNLEPNHEYKLQRAVNPVTVPDCTSTAWLTLGAGLTPQSIQTDAKGNGKAALWRDVTAIATGTQFRIHFQVIDAVTNSTVLISDCYMYEVR
jgi:hypothetical protein